MTRPFRLAAPWVLLAACAGADDSSRTDADALDAFDAFDAPDAPDVAAADGEASASDSARDTAPGLDGEPPANGLRGEYFDDYDDPRVVRADPTIDFDWPTGPPVAGIPHQFFSAQWSGDVRIDQADTFTFETLSDDGVRLFIDDKAVIEDWTGHFATSDKGSLALTVGWHSIRLEYFQLDLGASIHLFWSSPRVARAIVPAASLRAATAPSGGRAPAPPYTNPVHPKDCPDPGVLRVEESARAAYYLTCTGGRLEIYRSRDLVRWADTGSSILPSGKAPWSANGGRNWAPEIHAVGAKYVAYFTAVNGSDQLAIGAASADSPAGPFSVTSAPLVDDPTPGVIDPTFFRDDDGKQYLYWKRDGNAIGAATPIFVRELAGDGLSFAPGSSPVQVLVNEPSSWEGGVVEAPWVVKNGGSYYLFYSGNVYDQRYRTGVARAASPTGPFTKHGGPILQNNGSFVGPGHGSVVQAHGTDFWLYHAWLNDGSGGTAPGGRQDLLDPIQWTGGWPSIADGTPSHTPQAWP